MARICIRFRDGHRLPVCVSIPDGDEEVPIDVDYCDECRNLYEVTKDTDRFCSDDCRIQANSDKRPRKTDRRSTA